MLEGRLIQEHIPCSSLVSSSFAQQNTKSLEE
jgi:hypothetical protein